jgi:hypothetical protein
MLLCCCAIPFAVGCKGANAPEASPAATTGVVPPPKLDVAEDSLTGGYETSDHETKDVINAWGDIKTNSYCSVLDSTTPDGQSGLFYLSRPVVGEPRGQVLDVTGVGTIRKMGDESASKNAGVVYVLGQVQSVSHNDLAIQWKNGCSGQPEQLPVHLLATSKICYGKANYSAESLNTGDRITAEVKTSGTPNNTLIKAVVGDRIVRLRPIFQKHFALLGKAFYKEETCDYSIARK